MHRGGGVPSFSDESKTERLFPFNFRLEELYFKYLLYLTAYIQNTIETVFPQAIDLDFPSPVESECDELAISGYGHVKRCLIRYILFKKLFQ